MITVYKCQRCGEPLVWASHIGVVIALDAAPQLRFTMRQGPAAEAAEVPVSCVQTYQRHECTVPR